MTRQRLHIARPGRSAQGCVEMQRRYRCSLRRGWHRTAAKWAEPYVPVRNFRLQIHARSEDASDNRNRKVNRYCQLVGRCPTEHAAAGDHGKIHGLLSERNGSLSEVIHSKKACPIVLMCALMGVARSSYHAFERPCGQRLSLPEMLYAARQIHN